MRKKAFTLVELLVVIAIIAMLLAILMPALSRVRQLAYQMICGTNQSGLGKAIVLYSSENDEKYPVFGPPGRTDTQWWNLMSPCEWCDPDTFGPAGGGSGQAQTTVTSSMFLLVKYADVSPSQFICNAHNATKFKLSDYENTTICTGVASGNPAEDVTECWDFGTYPSKHVSFSFNYPYVSTSPDGSSPPAVPLMADLSPWMIPNTTTGATATPFVLPNPNADLPPQMIDYSLTVNKSSKLGNSPTHGGEGQNILFNDVHVKFMKTPNVGVEQDNIYTYWDMTLINSNPARMRQQGLRVITFPNTSCNYCPKDEDDAVLVNW